MDNRNIHDAPEVVYELPVNFSAGHTQAPDTGTAFGTADTLQHPPPSVQPRRPTVCGLSRKIFWLLVVVAIISIGVGVGVGVAVGAGVGTRSRC